MRRPEPGCGAEPHVNMIDGLIQWSLRNRVVVLAVAAAFLVWGGWVAT